MVGIFKVICLISLTASTVTLSTVKSGVKETPDYLTATEYAQVDYQDSVKGGVKITCNSGDTNNDFAAVTMTLPETIDISGADAFTIRLRGLSTSYPFFLHIIDADGHSVQLPSKSSSNYVRFYTPGGTKAGIMGSGGNDHSLMYSADCDGTMIMPLASLEALDGTIDYSKVKKLVVSVAVFYDYGFACAFGDLGIVTTDKQWVMKFDCSEYDFNQVYSVTAFPAYINISKMKSTGEAEWFGDTRILNSLDYDSTDELHANVSWNSGDNLCTYAQEGDAMRVHIGPYEVGHQYGSYMALKLTNSEGYKDYSFVRDNNGETELGKGLTMYLKNCSRREIGINLQFDELSIVEGKQVYERWIMKGYPAMYYAWDVNTDAEYIMYSKSDQFQIPIGFEGYVRIPFDQLQVPDWNMSTEGVDQILDITKFNKEFYLTSDNTRYEDLEFLIKNVGVYFNETYKANLFDDSHGIKANMGL